MPADVGADNVYEVTVLASDGGGAAGHEVAVTVADVDEAATVTSSTGSFVAGFRRERGRGCGFVRRRRS